MAKKKTAAAKRQQVEFDKCEKHKHIKVLGFCPGCLANERDGLGEEVAALARRLKIVTSSESELKQQYAKARVDLAKIVSAHKSNLESLQAYRKQSDALQASVASYKNAVAEATRAAESAKTELAELKAVSVEKDEKIDLLEIDNSLCLECCEKQKKEIAALREKLEEKPEP